MPGKTAIRGRLLDFIADPAEAGEEACYRYIADGAVVMEDGRIISIGPAADLPADMPVENYGQALILPGLIDTHIHYRKSVV